MSTMLFMTDVTLPGRLILCMLLLWLASRAAKSRHAESFHLLPLSLLTLFAPCNPVGSRYDLSYP